jgi:hypothetical protein
MKHLLIILSILLLSSPLFGQETGVLYRWETSSGLQWKTFGNDDVNTKYTGEIKNGKPDGVGISFHPPEGGESRRLKYTGEFKDGRWDGYGTINYPDGHKFVGRFKNWLENGNGTYYFPDGRKMVGEWREGKKWNVTGYYKNGNIYGKWVNGVRGGQKSVVVDKKRKGVLFRRYVDGKVGWYKDGNEKKNGKYVGEIENGKPNGQGIETYPSGSKYVGEWKDGVRNGQGTYTQYVSLLYPDGRKYVGEYKNGKEWNGTYYDNNGKKGYKLVNGEKE